ncbi:peptidoglycan-binding protein [Evansella clarkii]|uniref:peptidoglycan-binding protein n=1 Tax=Evansella clarkii TaxID=79879 RepID=UPI001ADC3CF0|nr:peptidoglycan-binding protein [Evansella clarkii]
MKIGMHHDNVIQLKTDLDDAGFHVSDNPTRYFGPQTESQVKAFQRATGISVDGIAGPQTFRTLENVVSSLMRNGVTHKDVVQLKLDLEKAGFRVSDNPTEFFGPITENRVKEFQREHNLRVTGIANLPTLETLNEIVSASSSGPLGFGDYDESVIQLKVDLSALGFHVSDNPTTYFGRQTESQVKAFQAFYGLTANGKADQPTMQKIDEVLDSPLQFNRRHDDLLHIKRLLNANGYGNITVTNYFGDFTELRVRQFQRDYGLPVSGIIDEVTRSHIEGLQLGEFQLGDRHPQIIELKKDLDKLGFGGISLTDLFGDFTEQRVSQFQRHYGLTVNGRADQPTLQKIEEILASPLQLGKRHDDLPQIKRLLNANGYGTITVTNLFGDFTESRVKQFQSDNGLPVSGIIDKITLTHIEALSLGGSSEIGYVTGVTSSLNVRSGPGTSHGVIGSLTNGTEVEILNRESNGWVQISYGNSVGYVSGQYINESDASPAPNPTPTPGTPVSVNTGTVTGVSSSLNVRSGPGTSHSAIGSVSRGATVQIKGTERNGWLRIDHNGRTGYVSGRYISLNVPSSGALRGKVIMLDPGHGDTDPGAIAGGMRESELVLDISLRAKRLLENQGATVIMTRSTDVFLTLSQRASLANGSNADVFVSVHANAFNGTANGTETFWNNRNQAANSEKLAHTLQNATVQKMGTNYRRVDQANYTVITSTRIPSALLEVGFMDHSGDAAKLRQSSYRDRSAEAIVEGLINYFR